MLSSFTCCLSPTAKPFQAVDVPRVSFEADESKIGRDGMIFGRRTGWFSPRPAHEEIGVSAFETVGLKTVGDGRRRNSPCGTWERNATRTELIGVNQPARSLLMSLRGVFFGRANKL